MTDFEVFLQQLITGLSNGMIIALIALGYSMVYGVVELINFAHGDLFMLGAFFALTVLGLVGYPSEAIIGGGAALGILLLVVPVFTAGVNFLTERYAYRPLRNSPRLSSLVSALGLSFIFLNIGLFWGGLPLEVFGYGVAAASPKDVPVLVGYQNLFGESVIQFTERDLLVFAVTIPVLIGLLLLVKFTRFGKAMRAVAQNPTAAALVGISSDQIVSRTFCLGGALAGFASVVYAAYNNSIFFQMGYRVGIDAFTAAVLGGIGNLLGATLGGLLIGLLRAFSDQYLSAQWTNVVVFSTLVVVLIIKPGGLLSSKVRDKV